MRIDRCLLPAGLVAGLIFPFAGVLAAPPAAGSARATLSVTATVEPACSASTAATGEEAGPVRVSCSADAAWSSPTSEPQTASAPRDFPLRGSRGQDGYVTVTY